jgi:dihydrofolate synthase/folylpolyglutamate synthase
MHPSQTSVQEAYAYWYGLINYEQRAPAATDLKLDRMGALLAALGDPHRHLRIVHVAGSKGKGSTAAMLAAILQAAGYRTGLFTSPHLVRVEERIQVDGQPISPEELAVWLHQVRAASEVASAPREEQAPPPAPTFFEVATAAGFLHFLQRRVDAAVLEVGLGGRFDSTNVCDPAVAIITSISFDHTRLLGNRLGQIAMEKAGILKRDRPAISGATAPEARTVIERIARERGVPLRQLGEHIKYAYQPGRVSAAGFQRPRLRVTTDRRAWPEMELNLLGSHQAANASVAVATVEELVRQGWSIPDRAVADGLAGVSWPARLEVLGRRPFVVLDCAHNDASARAVVDTLATSFPPGRRLLVFAGSNDKDLATMFADLAPQFDQAFLTRYTSNPRSLPPEQLADLLRAAGSLAATLHSTPAAAWHAARAAAGPDDLICITGSVFLAGELRPLLQQELGSAE